MTAFTRRTAVVAGLFVTASTPSRSERGALDGQRFEGVFIERGKTRGDADVLTFKDGRFHSSACDRFGYADAPYKSVANGDTITFEAETESAKYGRLSWAGAVRKGKLDATALMQRPGKAPLEHWVVAASKS